MTPEVFMSWEDKVENQKGTSAYVQRTHIIGSRFISTLPVKEKGWEFLKNNHHLTFVVKNMARPSEFFLMHHLKKKGGLLISSQTHYAALTGFALEPQPVNVVIHDLFVKTECEVSPVGKLEKVRTVDELVNYRTKIGGAMDKTNIAQGIPLPPIIAAALIKMTDRTLSRAFFTVINAMNVYDTFNQVTSVDQSLITKGRYVLEYLWASCNASHPNIIKGTVAMLASDAVVINWASQLRNQFVDTPPAAILTMTSPPTPGTTNPQPDTSFLGVLGQTNKVLGDMESHLSHIYTSTVKETESKKPGWGKFDKEKKLMFLRFASNNGLTWPNKPHDTLLELLKQQTAAEAHEYLTQQLRKKSIKSSVSPGMVSAVRLGQLISNEPGECKNLSIFLCPKRAYVLLTLTIRLQQMEGKGIAIEGIRELSSQELSFP